MRLLGVESYETAAALKTPACDATENSRRARADAGAPLRRRRHRHDMDEFMRTAEAHFGASSMEGAKGNLRARPVSQKQCFLIVLSN